MASRVRQFDWSATALGPIDAWSPELKAATTFVLDSAFPAALVWGDDFVTIYNDGFVPILGDKPDALGRSFAAIWAEAWDDIGPIATKAYAGEATYVENLPLEIDRSGRWERAYFTFAYSPVRCADGRIGGMIDIVTETTAAVAASTAARESEQRFQQFASSTDEVLWIRDAETMHLEFISPAFEQVFGVPVDEVMGDVEWGTALVGPDDRETVNRHLAAARNGATQSYEFRITRQSDGADCWIRDRCFPLLDDCGHVRRIGGIARDVTERRASEVALRGSEARHRLLIGGWAQAVWETDAEGVVVTDSPSWRAYTGQTLDEWLGYGWIDAVHPHDRAYAEQQWREAIATDNLPNAEFRLRSPDGGWRWTNVRAAPVLDAKGRVEKWASMNIDIHEKKVAHQALDASERFSRALVKGVPQLVWRAVDGGD